MKKTFKLVILGDPYVGKTSFTQRLCINKFKNNYDSTLGACFQSKIIEYKDQKIKLDIWDTAGQDRYRSLIPMYYRSADIAIIFFDLTNDKSFQNAKYWDDELEKNGNKLIIKVLVGNKLDLYKTQKKEYNIYYKISVKDNKNIKTLMDHICEELLKINKEEEENINIIINKVNKEEIPKNKCC